MGNFQGHWIPGTGFLICGLFLLMKAMNISFLKSFRTSPFWLNSEGAFKIIAGAIGILIEYSDMVSTNSNSQSHYDHLNILTVVMVLGILDLIHLHNLLRDSIWCMTSPVGFIYLGLRLDAHPQETDLKITAHHITANIFILVACSRAIEYLISIHTNNKYHASVIKKEMIKQENRSSSRNCLNSLISCSCCKRYAGDNIIPGYNSIYTNPQIYSTIFPMLTAMLVIFLGIWWWEMAVTLFLNSDPSIENDHMAMEMSYQMFGRAFLILIAITATISFLLHQIDRRFFRNDHQSLQLKLADDTVLEFEYDNSFGLEKVNIE